MAIISQYYNEYDLHDLYPVDISYDDPQVTTRRLVDS